MALAAVPFVATMIFGNLTGLTRDPLQNLLQQFDQQSAQDLTNVRAILNNVRAATDQLHVHAKTMFNLLLSLHALVVGLLLTVLLRATLFAPFATGSSQHEDAAAAAGGTCRHPMAEVPAR